jgi:hypothetical protein
MSQLLQIEVKSNTNKISIRFGVFGSFCHHLVYFHKTNLFSYLDKNIYFCKSRHFSRLVLIKRQELPLFPIRKISPPQESSFAIRGLLLLPKKTISKHNIFFVIHKWRLIQLVWHYFLPFGIKHQNRETSGLKPHCLTKSCELRERRQ